MQARGHMSRHLGANKVTLHTCPRCFSPRLQQSRRRSLVVRAQQDPYKVLGVPRGADSERIRVVYKKLMAEAKGNPARTKEIEEAHTAIIMSALSSRLQGGGEVAKEVKYADRAVYLPWRPRLYRADNKIVLYAGVVQALLAAWAVLLPSTAGSQPLTAAMCAGAGFNGWKQYQIFPPSPAGSESKQGRSGIKNILRGLVLALFATFIGCAVFYTVPDFLASQLNKSLPYWFYESEGALITIGSTLTNWLFTTFYR